MREMQPLSQTLPVNILLDIVHAENASLLGHLNNFGDQ